MRFITTTPTRLRQFTLLAIFSLLANGAIAGVSTPVYDPGYWNASNRLTYNNCYNYATNSATNTRAQPGRAYFGYTVLYPDNMSCSAARTAAALDGTLVTNGSESTFVFAGYTEADQCNYSHPSRLALVVAPGYDYHWYRIDLWTDGRWSHKRGQTIARDWDASGQPIYSVETADRGEYAEVCGYFCAYSTNTYQNSGVVKIN